MPERAALLAYAACFLAGSVPFGVIVARGFRVRDLTRQGSGNIGATNVSRVLGLWPAGVIVFVLDLLKGALPALLLAHGAGGIEPTQPLLWTAAFCAVAGHCYSPWLRFRGGKGVATALGALLVLSPLSAAAGAAAFALAFAATRVASLSSVSGLAGAAIAHLVFQPIGAHLWVGAALILVILIRHEGNFDALLENREKTFG